MPFPSLYLYLAAALVFLASVAGNVFLWKSRDAAVRQIGIERGHTVAVQGERDRAIASGRLCTEGLKKARVEQQEHDRQAKARLAAAEKRHQDAERRSQTTLQIPPAVLPPPTATPVEVRDAACASAEHLARQKLTERRGRITP